MFGGGIEYEAKFLDVDDENMRNKLKKIGAKLVHDKKRYVRSVFHRCTDEIRGFARVRDEGGLVTMTVKTYADPKFPEETEIESGSTFDDAVKFMIALGLKQKAFQETYREKWSLKHKYPDVHEITFDNVPGLPTYMEVDCTSESTLNEIIALLGLDKSKMRFGAFDATYEEYYGIAKKDINDNTPSLTFANIENEIKVTKNRDLLLRTAAAQRSMLVDVPAGNVGSVSAGSVRVGSVRSANTKRASRKSKKSGAGRKSKSSRKSKKSRGKGRR